MVLVDAYNVLHVTGVLPPDLAGVDLDGLAEMVARSRWVRGGRAVRLVCDGKAPNAGARRAQGQVVTVYAGAGKDADGHIERALERSSAARSITVVSSDRRLRAAAKRRRAGWLSSEAFLRQLAVDASRPAVGVGSRAGKPEVPLPRTQTALWLRVFGLEPPAPEEAAPVIVEPPPLVEAIQLVGQPAAEEWTPTLPSADLDMERWLKDADHPELRRRLAEARRARSPRSSRRAR